MFKIDVFRNMAEKTFFDGMLAAEAGISIESSPHNKVGTNRVGEGWRDFNFEEVACVYWEMGWRFSLFVRIQAYRREKKVEIRNALIKYKSFETEFNEIIEVINDGVLKHPLKYYSAHSQLTVLYKTIEDCPDVKFLKDLYFGPYTWNDETKTHFLVSDDILKIFSTSNEEGTIRRIVELFDEKYGAKDAWVEYIHSNYVEGYDGHSV